MAEARYLALGDSYTIGEGVAPAERWPVQLVARLRGAGLAVADPGIIARTGWTTAELAAAIREAAPHGPFDLVSLLIGVNNQYRGLPLDEYRAEFTALLEAAIALASGEPARVIVLSIPDWGPTPFAADRDCARIAHEIDAFNAANGAVAERRGCRYVDITPLSRSRGADPRFLAADGLHPSGRMYALWADAALSAAKMALASA